jgi:hypothetical protein
MVEKLTAKFPRLPRLSRAVTAFGSVAAIRLRNAPSATSTVPLMVVISAQHGAQKLNLAATAPNITYSQ